MSKKSKKILFYVVGAIFAIVLISQSARIYRLLKRSAQPVTDNLPVTITYWGLFQPEAVMEPLISKYEKENPNVTIKYEERRFDRKISEYKGTLYTRLSKGTGPTLFRIHSTWMPLFINEVSLKNAAISPEEFEKRFYGVAAGECVASNDQAICVPIMYDGLVLLYNVDMFNDAGILPPSTWDELQDASNRLKIYKEKELVRGGVALGTVNNVSNSSDIISLMMIQSDVEIPNDLDTNKAKAVVDFYKSFASGDNPGWNGKMTDSPTAFATEEVAMVFAKRWEILEILALNPTLNFGVLEAPQLPRFDGTTTSETWASFYVEAVSADASEKEQRAAWEFIDWLSQPEQQSMMFEESSKYMKFGEVYSDKTMADKISNSPILGPFVSQAPYAVTELTSANSGNDVFAALIDGLVTGWEDIDEPYIYAKAQYLRLLGK